MAPATPWTWLPWWRRTTHDRQPLPGRTDPRRHPAGGAKAPSSGAPNTPGPRRPTTCSCPTCAREYQPEVPLGPRVFRLILPCTPMAIPLFEPRPRRLGRGPGRDRRRPSGPLDRLECPHLLPVYPNKPGHPRTALLRRPQGARAGGAARGAVGCLGLCLRRRSGRLSRPGGAPFGQHKAVGDPALQRTRYSTVVAP